MRIHRPLAVLAVCIFFLSTQELTHAASKEAQVQYNARLNVTSGADLDKRLRAPFSNDTAHPAGILNCTQLLARQGRVQQASGQEFQAERSTLVGCIVLRELRRAVPARSSFVRVLTWDEHLLPLLPAQLAITVSAEATRAAGAAADQGRSWQNFDPSIASSISSKGPDEIVVTGNGFIERLVLWGRGDFDGDGLEGLLVQSFDTLTEGTYRNTRLFVLTRHSSDGQLSLAHSLF